MKLGKNIKKWIDFEKTEISTDLWAIIRNPATLSEIRMHPEWGRERRRRLKSCVPFSRPKRGRGRRRRSGPARRGQSQLAQKSQKDARQLSFVRKRKLNILITALCNWSSQICIRNQMANSVQWERAGGCKWVNGRPGDHRNEAPKGQKTGMIYVPRAGTRST